MRTVVRLTSLACLLAVGAFAQRGGFGFRGGGFRGGFGHGFARGGHVGFRTFPSFRTRRPFFFGGGAFFGAPIWPAFYDNYGYDNPYPSQASPNVIVVYPPPAPAPVYYEPAPAPAAPVVREYHWDNAPTGPAARLPIYFSFALRDSSVVRALAYWVQDDTLHYVDQAGTQKKMPLAEVDRARSAKLNRERGIDFGLPTPE